MTLPVTNACFVIGAPAYYAVALFQDDNDSGRFEITRLAGQGLWLLQQSRAVSWATASEPGSVQCAPRRQPGRGAGEILAPELTRDVQGNAQRLQKKAFSLQGLTVDNLEET